MTPLWGLVPVKGFSRAKSRLSPALHPDQRTALAQKLCKHVLGTLLRCPFVDGVLVLSDSPEVLSVARRCGASFDLDPPASPLLPPRMLGALVDDGLTLLQRRGAQAALVLMSDLPFLQIKELVGLMELLRDHDQVVAPDMGRRNTNALLLRLAGRTPTAFGSGDSFRCHTEVARAAGRRVAVYDSPGLAFDVDLPEDYARLQVGDFTC